MVDETDIDHVRLPCRFLVLVGTYPATITNSVDARTGRDCWPAAIIGVAMGDANGSEFFSRDAVRSINWM